MEELSIELLFEVVELYEEDFCTAGETSQDTLECFKQFIADNLPQHVVSYLKELYDCAEDANCEEDCTFLDDIYSERITARYSHHRAKDSEDAALITEGCCLICERDMKLTSHHVFPRSTHSLLLKRGVRTEQELSSTIRVCCQCHKMIHKSFKNELLASDYYSVELLLSDNKFFKYAQWASKLSNNRSKLVR